MSFFMKRGQLLTQNTKAPARNTAGTNTELWSKTSFQKRLGSDFYIAMSGATDPSHFPNSFFYSVMQFSSKNH